MPGFIKKKRYIIDTWQGSEYSSGSKYIMILNMSCLHKFLLKMLHHRCLPCLRVFPRFGIWQVPKYARATQTFHYRVCLKFSIYQDFEYIRNLNMLNFNRVYWCRVYIDKVLNIFWVLNLSEFWICSGNNFKITLILFRVGIFGAAP